MCAWYIIREDMYSSINTGIPTEYTHKTKTINLIDICTSNSIGKTAHRHRHIHIYVYMHTSNKVYKHKHKSSQPQLTKRKNSCLFRQKSTTYKVSVDLNRKIY